jgi:hypothetical protein
VGAAENKQSKTKKSPLSLQLNYLHHWRAVDANPQKNTASSHNQKIIQ